MSHLPHAERAHTTGTGLPPLTSEQRLRLRALARRAAILPGPPAAGELCTSTRYFCSAGDSALALADGGSDEALAAAVLGEALVASGWAADVGVGSHSLHTVAAPLRQLLGLPSAPTEEMAVGFLQWVADRRSVANMPNEQFPPHFACGVSPLSGGTTLPVHCEFGVL